MTADDAFTGTMSLPLTLRRQPPTICPADIVSVPYCNERCAAYHRYAQLVLKEAIMCAKRGDHQTLWESRIQTDRQTSIFLFTEGDQPVAENSGDFIAYYLLRAATC